jgi:hypothetical protein
MRPPVLALALGAAGTTEFVVVGLLPTVAADLRVGMATAGVLVTGYAIGSPSADPSWSSRRPPSQSRRRARSSVRS